VLPGDEVDLALRGTSAVGAVNFGWEVRVRRGGVVLSSHRAHTEPLGTPPNDGLPPALGAGESFAELGRSRWSSGDGHVALPELIAASAPGNDEGVAQDLVEALVARGEEVAVDALRAFQERFGPHPHLQVIAKP